MKIRTQFIITMSLFGLVVAVFGISLLVANRRIDRLSQQQEIAQNIERSARELGYLSNDYLLYQESAPRARWESKFAAFAVDLARLNPTSAEQQVLANNIKANAERLKAVFDNVVTTVESAAPLPDPATDMAFIQVSWSRMEVQNQGIVFDAQLLSQQLEAEVDQLNQANDTLIVALLAFLGVYSVANYLLIYRRALRSIAELSAGTQIIGSGSLDFTIPERSGDEIGALARAFNRMTANLKEVMASKADLVREMAERKRVEMQMKEVAEKYSTLFDTTSDGVWIHNLKGEILEVNDAYCRMSGYTRDKLIHMPISTLEAVESPEEIAQHIRKVLEAGGHDRFESRHRRKDGSIFDVDITALYLEREGGQIAVFVRDITERKQVEQSLQHALCQVEQLNRDLEQHADELQVVNKELESFSYSVSHDLRTPLASVEVFARLLAEEGEAQLSPDSRTYLRLVRENTGAMRRLIEGLLSFSRTALQPIRRQRIQPAEMVRQILAELCPAQDDRPREIVIGELPECEADPVLFKQVWVNLLSNAFKFSRERETPRIEVGYGVADGTEAYFVKDNGVGLDVEQAETLFGAFQRFHKEEEFEGTGVGLAIVERIIRRHGGRVWAEAEVGRGATFYFTPS